MQRIHLTSTPSTNTYARDHVSEFDPGQITCIDADAQTAGRGRQERIWLSPAKQNIYATFYFRLKLPVPHLASIGQVMTLSLATVLAKHNLECTIKWPNDVQIGEKKMAGVLCETEFSSRWVDIFCGIGINVNMDRHELDKIDQPATSLLIETHRAWDRKALLDELQTRFAIDLVRFKKEGFAPFHDRFEQLLAYKGEVVRCSDGGREWVGICHSITSDGRLNICLPDKTVHAVSSGEVRVRRQPDGPSPAPGE